MNLWKLNFTWNLYESMKPSKFVMSRSNLNMDAWHLVQLILSMFCLSFAIFFYNTSNVTKIPPSFHCKPSLVHVYTTRWSKGCPPCVMSVKQWMYKKTWYNVWNLHIHHFMKMVCTYNDSRCMCFLQSYSTPLVDEFITFSKNGVCT
jgi:hypothetical protein